MTVEKMVMVNLIGHLSSIDEITKSIIIFGNMHVINAMSEINSAKLTINVDEKNKNQLMEIEYIKPYINERDYKDFKEKIEMLKGLKKKLSAEKASTEELIIDYNVLRTEIDNVFYKIENVYNKCVEKKARAAEWKAIIESYEYIEKLQIPVQSLKNMKNFSFSLMKLSSDNVVKLRHNYTNIPSIVLEVAKEKEYTAFAVFTPIIFIGESERIFKALNYEQISLDSSLYGRPAQIIAEIKNMINILEQEIVELEKQLKEFIVKYRKNINILLDSVQLEMKSELLKSELAVSEDFFYLCGWIPISKLNNFETIIGRYKDNVLLIIKNADDEEIKAVPPTKLKNNPVFKPFELMIGMYGLPSYGEIDPTIFFGLSYMILFGAMFGDVGQGLVFLVSGLIIKRFKNMNASGGIAVNLGISSILFGVFYGSVFGFENVIQPVFIRPMDNITQILIYAVVFGVLLLVTGFIYSLINNIRKGDMENGLFGKDGVAGLTLYMLAIVFALTKYYNVTIFPGSFWTVIFTILILLIIMKEPAAKLIKNKRPLFSKSKPDYFIEESFGSVEAVLSMFTNTLSFIRVGAFALNHVGLFLAFSTLALMVRNNIGSILIYIIGNIVIISLEGLIVFIQGLRLEYYELFSKYYEANGIAFKPITLSDV
jgi:V/A-type H+-transporting ATPase subunit I